MTLVLSVSLAWNLGTALLIVWLELDRRRLHRAAARDRSPEP